MYREQPGVAWLLVLILMVSGLACTSMGKVDSVGGEPAAREACFDSRNIRFFAPLHEKYVYIHVGRNEHYLLTLEKLYLDAERPLFGRPRSGVITITGSDLSNHFNRICWDTRAEASYMADGEPVFRRIVHIEAVASKEAAQKLVEIRTALETRS